MYSFDEIKEVADCLEIARQWYHLEEVNPGYFNRPWSPGSNSGALHVETHQWFDHVDKIGGDQISFVAKIEFDGDNARAAIKIGERYNLKPAGKKSLSEIVCTYDYSDPVGNVVFQVVRFNPKTFKQRRRVDKKWVWNLRGVQRYPYQLPEWKDKKIVCIAEGEKDVDNLVKYDFHATTAPGGSKKWQLSYNKYFAGKKVIIFADNDKPGREHVQTIHNNIAALANEIRVVYPPVEDGGDISDFIHDHKVAIEIGLTDLSIRDAIQELIEHAQVLPITDKIERAKRANEEPFSNYKMVVIEKDGAEKRVKEPILIRDLVNEIFQRFHDFPARVGGIMFDHDHDTKRIRMIQNPDDLFAWIEEKSQKKVFWCRIEGAVTRSEIYSSLYNNARLYHSISSVPSFPQRDDVYYIHPPLPEPDPELFHFNEFCSFFDPATDIDSALIRVFVASCIYFRAHAKRPLWVIDSIDGQSTGKTTMVEMVAMLLGTDEHSQSAIMVPYQQIKNDTQAEKVYKRIISESGRRKRILLLDNVVGRFQCPELASLITTRAISAIAPYGRGDETRPNDLTYVITSNTATLDEDLADRSFLIFLKMYDKTITDWSSRIITFIHENRYQILSDIIYLLSRQKSEQKTTTRYSDWEQEVLIPVVNDPGMHEKIIMENSKRQMESNIEREEAELIREKIINGMQKLGVDTEEQCVFLQSETIIHWASEAVESWRGYSKNIISRIKNFAKNRSIPELSTAWTIYPHGSKQRKRGVVWNFENNEKGVIIIGLKGEKPIIIVDQLL